MRKMVIVQELKGHHIEALKALVPDWKLVHGHNKEIWEGELIGAEIVGGRWNRHVLEVFLSHPEWHLKWVQHFGAGVDYLPLAEFSKRDVLLTNSSGVSAYPIAETVLAFMLNLTRKIDTYVRNQSKRIWHHSGITSTSEMHAKTVGILGVGAIGEEIARLCKAFGMRVLGVRRSATPSPVVDEMVGISQLTYVLSKSDYVVNALPLTDETRKIIGKVEFQAMKSSAFYINIGRGGTTDEEAMIRALQQGDIAGAGLDVFEVEPLPEYSPLWDMDNVIVAPHSAGSTEHYNDRAIEIFTNNLKNYLVGEGLSQNLVDLRLRY
ncbi:MAG: D-2-hydroxyacid dehydrogenase [Desulfosporosinus sp.]|nr:D-2-hydroxyacid dehydrogenase [Desulfosporosinus sp.]